jgi:glycosyltransferase involved in cell wall biosynthesis
MTVSVVIICKNEAGVIADTVLAAQKASADIVVLDSGSTDGTQQILQQYNVRILHEEWVGFGPTKNKAIKAAQHDWVLQIDADERIDDTLANYIKQATPEDEITVYNMRFRNYLGETALLHGEWGKDRHIRLFNRKAVLWNDAEVHEELILPPGCKIIQPPGYVHHVTAESKVELRQKMDYYARLSARKYQAQGKKYSRLRMICSPPVNFIINYLFKLGFLDGRAGWVVACESARYTWLKYRLMSNKK